MNSNPLNLKITIHSLFFKQLCFHSPPFLFFFFSLLFSFRRPFFFFFFFFFSFSAFFLSAGSNSNQSLPNENGFKFLQFRKEIQWLMIVPLENASSYTTLLELPTTQAMELLHSQSVDEAPTPLSGDPFHRINNNRKPFLTSALLFSF